MRVRLVALLALGLTMVVAGCGRQHEPPLVVGAVDDAARYGANDDGAVSQVYPALGLVPRDLFGVCVAGGTAARFEKPAPRSIAGEPAVMW